MVQSFEFSVVLDLIRFLAALVVVAGHVARDGLYDGWAAIPMWAAHAAVLVFFVVSGAVIAESATRPGLSLRDFAIARASRLYSVVLPAIVFSYAVSMKLFRERMTTLELAGMAFLAAGIAVITLTG